MADQIGLLDHELRRFKQVPKPQRNLASRSLEGAFERPGELAEDDMVHEKGLRHSLVEKALDGSNLMLIRQIDRAQQDVGVDTAHQRLERTRSSCSFIASVTASSISCWTSGLPSVSR